MRSELLRGLKDADAIKERKAIIKGGLPAIKIIRQVLEDKHLELMRGVLEEKNYTDPSWAYQQADKVGEARALKYMIELLTTLDREE